MSSATDTFLSIVGTYRVDPADAAAFASIAAGSVPATVSKMGCLYYIASQDVNEAGVFHLSEGWSDKAALDAAYKQVADALRPEPRHVAEIGEGELSVDARDEEPLLARKT